MDRAKQEVLDDIANGVVPERVTRFTQLHDHVDANEYGGLCEDGWESALVDQVNDSHPHDGQRGINYVQGMVNAWLEADRKDSAPCAVCGQDVLKSPATRRCYSDWRPHGVLVCGNACSVAHYSGLVYRDAEMAEKDKAV